MLREKALVNLVAGGLLLEARLHDPAASRLYYAMYQAAVHRFRQMGWAPGRVRSGAVHWDHAMVANNVKCLRGRTADRWLYGRMLRMRVEADYDDAPVREADVAGLRGLVARFVEEVTA
jgi:hypothetical protein